MDPDLADFLTEAAHGNISTWLETWQQKLANIEGRIEDARAAIQFGRAVDDLTGEEHASSPAEANAGEEETSAPRSAESAGVGPAETLNPQKPR